MLASAQNQVGGQHFASDKGLPGGPIFRRRAVLEDGLAQAEQFGPSDVRLGASLNALAQMYREEASTRRRKPLFKQALAILERRWGRRALTLPELKTIWECSIRRGSTPRP